MAREMTPQPEQALTTEYVQGLLECVTPGEWISPWSLPSDVPDAALNRIVNAAGELVIGIEFDDGSPMLHVTEADAALITAAPDLARDLLAERTAHAATRAEADRLRAALAEAEALAEQWQRTSADTKKEAGQTPSEGAASYALGWAQAESRCAYDLTQALATAQAQGKEVE